MLDLGRLAQDLARLFEPPGRWLFVKIVVLAFTGSAVARLLPKKASHVVGKRPRRAAVRIWAAAMVAALASVAALAVVGVQADHQLVAYNRHELVRYENRPAHAELTAKTGQYLGVYEPSAPYTYSQVQQFARATRSRPNMALYYSTWNLPFQASFAQAAYASHATTMIQLMPTGTSLAAIAAGASDKYLTAFARSVRDFRHPVVIGFAPEMNGNWYQWGYQNSSPRLWVAAWRHLVDVFRANGAGNVSWLWTVNMIYYRSGPLKDYWPGSSYVTWVGIDAYFVPQKHAYKKVIDPTLRKVRAITSDPVIISETGIAPAAGQVSTLRTLFAGLRADQLLGFVYFDGDQVQDADYHYKWRLEDNPAAVAEYARLANGTRYGPPPGSLSATAGTR
jgi:Glycosyl hydrolase family 26